jgi:hypothetical protein
MRGDEPARLILTDEPYDVPISGQVSGRAVERTVSSEWPRVKCPTANGLPCGPACAGLFGLAIREPIDPA